jgi:hypothetical protein
MMRAYTGSSSLQPPLTFAATLQRTQQQTLLVFCSTLGKVLCGSPVERQFCLQLLASNLRCTSLAVPALEDTHQLWL